mgnify:CR=1 FL=1
MKEWRYLVFLVKYHLNRWIREKKQGGVFYIGGSDVFPPPLKPEEELVLLEQLGGEEDVTVKSVLIERNLRLVVYIARKFENTGINVEDLISIGTIGLIKAVNSFKPDKSIRLATYAAKCIDNELLMMLRMEKRKSKEVSMYEPIGKDKEGNEISLIDIVGEEKEDVVEDCLFAQRVLCLYQNLDKVLNEREKTIIIRRYGLNGKEPMTQSELADRLGISRSYISRIEKKALLKLKKLLEDAKL